MNFSQHFRPHDRRPRRLLRNIHALLSRRLAQELPSLRLPCDQFHFSGYTGISVLELLEVCAPPIIIQTIVIKGKEVLMIEIAGEVVKSLLLRRACPREPLLVLNKIDN